MTSRILQILDNQLLPATHASRAACGVLLFDSSDICVSNLRTTLSLPATLQKKSVYDSKTDQSVPCVDHACRHFFSFCFSPFMIFVLFAYSRH